MCLGKLLHTRMSESGWIDWSWRRYFEIDLEGAPIYGQRSMMEVGSGVDGE